MICSQISNSCIWHHWSEALLSFQEKMNVQQQPQAQAPNSDIWSRIWSLIRRFGRYLYNKYRLVHDKVTFVNYNFLEFSFKKWLSLWKLRYEPMFSETNQNQLHFRIFLFLQLKWPKLVTLTWRKKIQISECILNFSDKWLDLCVISWPSFASWNF